jgi:hypothetical protein
VALFSRRLPHVITRADLARLLTPTYAEALAVDEEEAHERLGRALAGPGAAEEIYEGLSAALAAAQGARTSEDELMDKLSRRIEKKRQVKAAPATPALSAVMIRLNLEIGLAPESMRDTLASEKGRAMLRAGRDALGAHLVKELLRSGR